MMRRPPRSTPLYSSAASDVYKRQGQAISSAASLSIADDSEFVPGRVYLIPVTIKSATGDLDIIEAGRTIFLKVSRTLRFHAPYVGQASMAYQFLLPDPIPSLPTYTWAVSYTHLRAHETGRNLVCRLLLEKKKVNCCSCLYRNITQRVTYLHANIIAKQLLITIANEYAAAE